MTREFDPTKNWEVVAPTLWRINVPGGWLYHVDAWNEDEEDHASQRAVALCFVPFPPNWVSDETRR